MTDPQISVEEIQKDITAIAEKGIGVDRRQLLQDMCTQFTEYWEWLREYCVNASDALAKHCTITIEEKEDRFRIIFEDDGHGMPKDMVVVFMTLFKSVKFGKKDKTVGCHGVGKLSVFASSDLTGFAMTTSTGKECWQMKTGSFLDDNPITINRIEPVPRQGTRFEIEYEKKLSLEQLVSKARQILQRYCQYLQMQILLKSKSVEPGQNFRELIKGSWHYGQERMARLYQGEDFRGKYEVIIGINNGRHSVYQNRVLISDHYNLLTIDGTEGLRLPGLDIRINSSGFKLNFGRNKLTNEAFLICIASKIRKTFIPDYFNRLAELYLSGASTEIGIGYSQIESLACGILKYRIPWIKSAYELPMFRLKNRPQCSFAQLDDQVKRAGKLYLENSDSTGVDFSVYDGPVLSLNQPPDGLEFLKKKFSRYLINLGLNDVVMEIPDTAGKTLGQRELSFEKKLGFHPGSLRRHYSQTGSETGKRGSISKTVEFSMALQKDGFLDKVCEESRDAQTDLEYLKWKVNYLVERDGKTPNKTHKFLVSGNTVVLNLNHTEIQQLLKLSERSGNLAGHWAMAICLCEGNSILKHLTPEAREDLLIIDAMSRCGRNKNAEPNENPPKSYETNPDFDFELNHIDLWL